MKESTNNLRAKMQTKILKNFLTSNKEWRTWMSRTRRYEEENFQRVERNQEIHQLMERDTESKETIQVLEQVPKRNIEIYKEDFLKMQKYIKVSLWLEYFS